MCDGDDDDDDDYDDNDGDDIEDTMLSSSVPARQRWLLSFPVVV